MPEKGVFIVADGMGGHAAGEVASEMAVQIIARGLDTDAAQIMSKAIIQSNAEIYQRTMDEPEKRGMGTTATAMVINGNRFILGQVGDSRAYVYRETQLAQVTKDHSYVQEQVDAGNLTPEQARTHPYSNVITRCVGANADVIPDIYLGTVETEDVILLASDGLTGMLEDQELLAILEEAEAPAKTVDNLVSEANRRGGLDNITVIVVRIDKVEEVP
jgi:protein phosphatase